jgi:cytochrome c
MAPRRLKVAAASSGGVFALLVIVLFTIRHSDSVQAQSASADGPPTVKITAPSNGSTYNWNTLVHYHIVVTYQGKSTEYQELPSNQVLLTATYISDLSKIAVAPASAAGPAPAGLLDILRSNCLGCHQFKAKSTGPSFAAIAGRYPQSQATVDLVSRNIRNGSAGAWGQESMPPHPELTEDQAHAIALWILKNAADPNVSEYVGTEGAIRLEAPGTPDAKAGMMLTASYTSPTPTTNAEQAPHGEDTVMVHGK